LEQADHQLNQTEYRLSELQQQFAVDTSALAANVVDFERELDEIQLFSKKLESDWTQQRDELNQALSVAKADSEKLESDLEQIESEYDDWQSQDIETLQSNLQQLPQWESELETSSTRYTLLTEKHQDVEASFNKRVAQISEKLNEELEGYSEEKSLLQDKLSEQKSQEQLKLQQIRDDYQGQLSSVESEYRQRADELKTQYTEITAALKNAGFDEFEQSQLDILDATLKEAGIAEDAAREKHPVAVN